MTKEARYLTAGKLVTFTSGEYSDYSMHGTYVALKDMTFRQARELEVAVRELAYTSFEHTDPQYMFQAELIKGGYLLEVDNTERHIGSYGELEI